MLVSAQTMMYFVILNVNKKSVLYHFNIVLLLEFELLFIKYNLNSYQNFFLRFTMYIKLFRSYC